MKILIGLLITLAADVSLAWSCMTDIVKDPNFGDVRYRTEFINYTSPRQIVVEVLDPQSKILKTFSGFPLDYRVVGNDEYWTAEEVYEVPASGSPVLAKDGTIEVQKLQGYRGLFVFFKSQGSLLTSAHCF